MFMCIILTMFPFVKGKYPTFLAEMHKYCKLHVGFLMVIRER